MQRTGISEYYASILAGIVSSLAALSAGYAIGFSSPAIQDLQNSKSSLRLSSEQATWFGSLLPLMAMFGSLFSGPLMDHIGRRAAIVSIVVCFLISWTIMFFSTTLVMLFSGRGLLGLATGSCTAVIPVYISEISPALLRGTMGTVFSVFLVSGIPTAYGASVIYNWKEMTEIGGITACLTILLCVLLPESPYWLLRQNRVSEAFKSLKQLRGKGSDIASEVKDIQSLQFELQGNVTRSEIANSSFLKPVFIGLALMLFQQFSGVNVIFFYAHEIFQRANFHDENMASILVSLVQVAVTIFVTALMDNAGRRKLLLLSAVGMMICHAMLGACMHILAENKIATETNGTRQIDSHEISYASNETFLLRDVINLTSDATEISNLQILNNSSFNSYIKSQRDKIENEQEHDQSVTSWLSLACVVLYIVFYAVGFGPVPYIALSEMLPQRGRGVAGGVVTMANWFCAFALTKSFRGLVELITAAGVFWLFSIVCLFSVIFIWRYVPETKGKTLSEIQEIFSNQKNSTYLKPPEKRPERSFSSVKVVKHVGSGTPVIIAPHRSASVLEQTTKLMDDC